MKSSTWSSCSVLPPLARLLVGKSWIGRKGKATSLPEDKHSEDVYSMTTMRLCLTEVRLGAPWQGEVEDQGVLELGLGKTGGANEWTEKE